MTVQQNRVIMTGITIFELKLTKMKANYITNYGLKWDQCLRYAFHQRSEIGGEQRIYHNSKNPLRIFEM